jgi:hypothetical protein
MARKRGGITLRDESSNEKTLKECKRTQSLQKNAKFTKECKSLETNAPKLQKDKKTQICDSFGI